MTVMRAVFGTLLALASGCASPAPSTFSYYDERIAPILDVGCQRQTTGCHVDDGRGFALGNLDLSSYDALMRRADVLAPFGPYPVGVLLLKSGEPVSIDVQTIDPAQPRVRIETDVRHGGGEGAISQGSHDYSLLKQWIDGGHTRTGVPVSKLATSQGECVHAVPQWSYLDADLAAIDGASLRRFVRDAQPALVTRCAGSVCHGTELADFSLSCGSSDAEQRWNYVATVKHLDDVASASPLLRVPLSITAGGVYHEGGDVFESVEDPDYRKLRAFAESVVEHSAEALAFGEATAGLQFFANRVQPLLVRKGCMFLNCHSPAMFHELRLRAGSAGSFSKIATYRNYDMSRKLLALESADPNQSRLIAKNLCPEQLGGAGLAHRGGPLFEDFGGCAKPETRAGPARCDGVDADGGDLNEVPAYCVLARWHALEREAAVARGDLPTDAPPSRIVFVVRPEGVGGVMDFDAFRPGADLVVADATFDAQGALTLGTPRSLLGGCGLGTTLDVRSPAVSWDATRIAFAARGSDTEPLRVYEMGSDGSDCAEVPGLAADAAQRDGILLHDFDPAYAPDGRLVFASTRGNIAGAAGYGGPTRTPAALAPNANLYVYEDGAVRQLTFLLNQELAPSFMADGRVIFTAEKRAQDFHQLAARRLNLDGGDYHPLIAQRPSVGFASATEVIQLANHNFAAVAGPLDAVDGGGTIVIVNRSIGPDQTDRDPRDKGFIHALDMPVPGAFGGGAGVVRSPAALPSGRLLVACDLSATDVRAGTRHYGLCELSPSAPSQPRLLWRDPARVAVEPAVLWPRMPHVVFASRIDEANGSTRIEPGATDVAVLYTDFPMLATLLFENTRIGRPMVDGLSNVEIFESLPPPSGATRWSEIDDGVVMDGLGPYFERRRSLGRAPLQADGSFKVLMPGGLPISLELQDGSGKPLRFGKRDFFTGAMHQREHIQFYPGERAKQSVPRRLFNGICGGCHGSISGRELDVVVGVDVLTSASKVLADDAALDLR